MKSLQEQLAAYAAYHSDRRNKLTHFFGVPLVTFALFVPMGWFRLVFAPDLPLVSGATIFYLSVFVYYVRLDWGIALLQVPVSVALLFLADRVSLWPAWESLLVFLATFIGGWAIQLLGHALEGRRPALTDNFLQIFNAPLFLTAEVLFLLGLRKELQPALGPSQQPSSPAAVKELQDLRA
jgi:uncharacterized membrane protein YGL010W